MTDRYERWNNWAPRFIADLVHDFSFTPEQAAGFVGNFAAESAYFNDIVEDGAIAKGWAGGTGFAQWTGPRRKTFEAWLKKKGYKADSYEGNYSYLFRELKGLEKSADHSYVVPLVKAAKTPENAAWRVAYYFERPKVINLGPRAKAAKEALELYRKHPVPPTQWTTPKDEKEEAQVPIETGNTNVVAMPAEPAKPVLQSKVMQGAMGGVAAALYALSQTYDPALSFKMQPMTFWAALAGLLGALWTVYGRVSSNAQPLTWTQDGADKVAAERTIAGPAAGNGTTTASVVSPVPIVQSGLPVPIGLTPVAGLEQGLQQVTGVLDLLGIFAPQLRVLSTIAHAVTTDQPPPPPPPRGQ